VIVDAVTVRCIYLTCVRTRFRLRFTPAFHVPAMVGANCPLVQRRLYFSLPVPALPFVADPDRSLPTCGTGDVHLTPLFYLLPAMLRAAQFVDHCAGMEHATAMPAAHVDRACDRLLHLFTTFSSDALHTRLGDLPVDATPTLLAYRAQVPVLRRTLGTRVGYVVDTACACCVAPLVRAWVRYRYGAV